MSNTPNPRRRPLKKLRDPQRLLARLGLRLARLGDRVFTHNGSLPRSGYEQTREAQPALALPAFLDLRSLRGV